jgi:uncharacterized protein (TIGR02246 family)
MIRKMIPLLVITAACTTPPAASPATVPDRSAEVLAAIHAYAAALKSATPDSVATFYADDGELVLPGMAPVHGPAAVRAFLAPMAAAGQVDSVSITSDELTVHGDTTADQRGRYFQVAGERGKPHGTYTGGYDAAWRRGADGRWRFVRLAMHPDPRP